MDNDSDRKGFRFSASSLYTQARGFYAHVWHICKSVFSLTTKEQQALWFVIALFVLGCLVRMFHWWNITE